MVTILCVKKSRQSEQWFLIYVRADRPTCPNALDNLALPHGNKGNYHPPAEASPGRLRRACHREYSCIELSLVSPPDGVSAGPCTSVAAFSAALQIEAM